MDLAGEYFSKAFHFCNQPTSPSKQHTRNDGNGVYSIGAIAFYTIVYCKVVFSFNFLVRCFREGVRLTTLRIVPSPATHQFIVNLSYLPSALLVLSTTVLLVFRSLFTFDTQTLLCYALGALLECLGEPLYNLYNSHAMVTPRLKAESLATSVRCVVSYVLVVYFNFGVYSFAFAQTCYGLTHFLTLRFYATSLPIDSHAIIFPRALTLDDLFNRQYLQQALNFTGTSIIKHVITEADKITLSMTMTAYHQGVYAVCHNYGSLVARMIYLPIEDASRITFSKLFSQLDHNTGKDFSETYQSLFSAFRSTFRGVLLLSVWFPLYGPAYIRLLVRFLLGAQWYSDEVVTTLSLYCLYLHVLALNGVSEAFVQSVTSNFQRMNMYLIASSIFFAITAVVSIHYVGTGGIVIANCFSMLVRIVFNMNYILDYFNHPLNHHPHCKAAGLPCSISDFLLPMSECAYFVAFATVTYISSVLYAHSELAINDTLFHVGIGGCVFICVLLVAYQYHRTDIHELIISRKISSEKKA